MVEYGSGVSDGSDLNSGILILSWFPKGGIPIRVFGWIRVFRMSDPFDRDFPFLRQKADLTAIWSGFFLGSRIRISYILTRIRTSRMITFAPLFVQYKMVQLRMRAELSL